MITTDLSLPRGDSITYDLAVVDEDGDAFPLTGATVKFTIRAAVDSSLVFQLTSASVAQINVYDAPHGKAYIIIENAHTQDLSIQQYQYDVEVINSTGKVSTVCRGTFNVTSDITR